MSSSNSPGFCLEQYRKQAKDLVKAHRAGDAEAMALVREHLPRLGQATEGEIREAQVALQEAQHVVARRHDYKDWDWLRAICACDFDVLGQFSDRDVQALLRRLDHDSLVLSLAGSADGEAGQRLLACMSPRVRAELVQQVEAQTEVAETETQNVRRAILCQCQLLAKHGEISWPGTGGSAAADGAGTPVFAPRLVELAGMPLEEMSPAEIAEMLGEMAGHARANTVVSLAALEGQLASPYVLEAVQLTADAVEPDLVQDILKTRSEKGVLPVRSTRGSMIVEGIMAVVSNDTPRMVHHKLSTFYEAEVGEHRVEYPQVTSAELAGRAGAATLAELPLPAVDAFMTDLAAVWQREGVEGLRALVPAAGSALFELAVELLEADTDHGALCEALEEQHDRDVEALRQRHRMVAGGIRAVWELASPSETQAAAMAAGQAAA